MLIKKNRLPLLLFAALIILAPVIMLLGRAASRETVEHVFPSSPVMSQSPSYSGNGIPLPVPSHITTEIGGLRLDLERISVNKYYIVYSVIYGDQSHTAYHLYLTDLSRERLNPGGVGKIWLETAGGKRILPAAMVPQISGFPADQPLGWKIAVTVRFPYQTKRETHSLCLQYQDKRFKLSGISY